MKKLIKQMLWEQISGEKKKRLVQLFFQRLLDTDFEVDYVCHFSDDEMADNETITTHLKPELIWLTDHNVIILFFESYIDFPGFDESLELVNEVYDATLDKMHEIAENYSFNLRTIEVAPFTPKVTQNHAFYKQRGWGYYAMDKDGKEFGNIDIAVNIL
jgi:hypothetical protein